MALLSEIRMKFSDNDAMVFAFTSAHFSQFLDYHTWCAKMTSNTWIFINLLTNYSEI